MKRIKGRGVNRARLGVCALLAVFLLTACGDGSRIIFTGGMGKNEVFRIGSSVCTVPEMMVYLANTRNQYEKVYGPEVWKISLDGVTLEENVKETVLAKIAQIKTMYLLAQSREIVLEEGENRRVEQAAAEYYNSLNETERELIGADEATIEQLYREYALADKVYRDIIQDVNPEISDDEARTITVQHILFRTGGAGDSGPGKETVYEQACQVYQMAVDGEHDFVDLASRYSEDMVTTISFGKGEMDGAFEEAAFALETGEVSQVVETKDGYEIIKCISTFDKGQTDANKLEIVEERRRQVFGQEYNVFVDTLARQLNTEVWEEMALPEDEEVTTSVFFDIFARYFPEAAFSR